MSSEGPGHHDHQAPLQSVSLLPYRDPAFPGLFCFILKGHSNLSHSSPIQLLRQLSTTRQPPSRCVTTARKLLNGNHQQAGQILLPDLTTMDETVQMVIKMRSPPTPLHRSSMRIYSRVISRCQRRRLSPGKAW